jgi:cytoskeletal protein CcmA (bactofilin family)
MSESADPLEAIPLSTQPAETSSGGDTWDRFQQFWRRKFRPVRIQGQQTQDVHSDRSVTVAEGAVLAGSIIAPHITVSGLVYGYLVAREVVVKASGQVWGDVYTLTLKIEEGGTVHGWTSTPDEATLVALANGTIPAPQNRPELPAGLLPAGAEQEADIPTATARLILLQYLQAEAGAAIVSRAELERTFEQRVSEVAGEAFTRLKFTRADLETSRQEKAGLQANLVDLQAALADREQRIAHQKARLAENQSKLVEHAASVLALQTLLAQKTGDLEAVQAANKVLEGQLQDAFEDIDVFSGRVENLEAALQASLQRAAEQEEALLRWQELAEVTQVQVKELQTELENQQFQAQREDQVIERLREQNQRAEEALAHAHEEIAQLQKAPPAETAESGRVAELVTALALVEKQLVERETHAGELQMEISSQKVALQSTHDNLEHLQQTLAARDQTIGELRAEVSAQTTHAENWKNTVGRLSELLYAADQRVQEMGTRLNEQERAGRKVYNALRNQVRQQKLQLEAMEKEVAYFDQELLGQGQRLAQAQAELTQKHITLDKLKTQLEERTRDRDRIKTAATKHIKALEAELAKTKRQLNDLLAWAERRR